MSLHYISKSIAMWAPCFVLFR